MYTHPLNAAAQPEPVTHTESRARMQAGIAATLLFHAFYAAWLLFKPVSARVTHLGDDVLETVGGVLAAALCFWPVSGANVSQKTPLWSRAGWTEQSGQIAWLSGLSMVCYALQQVCLIFPDFFHRPAPIPRLAANLIAVLAYPLLLAGLWRLPRKALSASAQGRISLDALMVLCAALTFSWYFVLGPAVLSAKNALEEKVFDVSFPLLDVLLTACLLLLGGRTGVLRSLPLLIAAGLVIVVASDSVFTYISLHRTFVAGTLIDIGWSLGFMLIGTGIAASRQAMLAETCGDAPERLPPLAVSLLPYALLPLVGALVLYTDQAGGRAGLKHGVFWGALALICLILLRQVLALLENRELNARLEGLATTDPLTGLLNHRTFHLRLAEEAEAAARTGQPLAVAMLDLDNFKFFNDAYGHAAGDGVLRRVASALQDCATVADTLARFGGDEFALLLPIGQIGSHGLSLSAAGLQRSLKASLDTLSFQPLGSPVAIPLSISVGIALFPTEAESCLEALELADRRLLHSKTGGGAEHPAEQLCSELTLSLSGFSMLNALVTAVDNKDRYTRRHSEDVLAYSLQIADHLGLDAETRRIVQIAALLHDVGKIGVPDRVLRKPATLTDDEFEAVKQHPVMGAVIVGAVPGFEETLAAVRHHHERWDGGGYPSGLSGTETPFLARLIAVADAFSAMTTDRPYRKGMERGKALRILEDGAGSQWDPECVHALLRVYRPQTAKGAGILLAA